MSDLVAYENGLVLLFGSFFFELRTGLLLALLAAAVVWDVRTHRIPNWLVVIGLAIAIGYHSFMPQGAGWSYALKGAGVGLGLFLPLYLLRAMGAGDVKLMAMVGSFLGPLSALGAVLTTLIAGGVLAIGVALWRGVLAQTFANIRYTLTHAAVKVASGAGPGIAAAPTSTGKLPYAVAIAVGTFVHLVLLRTGHALVG